MEISLGDADWSFKDLFAVSVLSLVAVAPLLIFDISIGAFFRGSIGTFVKFLAASLVLLPLPAAYVTSISTEKFRKETVGAAVVLPLSVLGLYYAAFTSGLFLGLLLISYKSRSVYHGDNFGWTSFKTVGSVLTVLALVLGATAAFSYQSSPEMQDDLQGALTNTTVDIAIEYTGISGQNIAPGGGNMEDIATQLSENVSRQSILMTEKAVFRAVEESGSFTEQQKTLLRSTFSSSSRNIPGNLSNQVQERLDTEPSTGEMDVEDLARSRVKPLIEKVTAPETPFLVLIFLTVLSTVYMFKLPFRFLGSIYALIIRAVRKRL